MHEEWLFDIYNHMHNILIEISRKSPNKNKEKSYKKNKKRNIDNEKSWMDILYSSQFLLATDSLTFLDELKKLSQTSSSYEQQAE